MSFWCRIGWHEWGAWKRTTIDLVDHEPVRTVTGQERYCSRCNKEQVKW